jgi:hypothetical protein
VDHTNPLTIPANTHPTGAYLDFQSQFQIHVHRHQIESAWIHPAKTPINNPASDLARHAWVREEQGLRPGGFGIMIAKKLVDEIFTLIRATKFCS